MGTDYFFIRGEGVGWNKRCGDGWGWGQIIVPAQASSLEEVSEDDCLKYTASAYDSSSPNMCTQNAD